jgi:hypothetical protein
VKVAVDRLGTKCPQRVECEFDGHVDESVDGDSPFIALRWFEFEMNSGEPVNEPLDTRLAVFERQR